MLRKSSHLVVQAQRAWILCLTSYEYPACSPDHNVKVGGHVEYTCPITVLFIIRLALPHPHKVISCLSIDGLALLRLRRVRHEMSQCDQVATCEPCHVKTGLRALDQKVHLGQDRLHCATNP